MAEACKAKTGKAGSCKAQTGKGRLSQAANSRQVKAGKGKHIGKASLKAD
jgi:hypothetical protein